MSPADLASAFLRRHPPFFYLQADELLRLVKAAREIFLPRGDTVGDLQQDLVVVRQGAVAELAGTERRMIELRDEGSIVGLSAEAESIRHEVHEDAILLRLPGALVRELAAANERFADFFTRRDRHRRRFLDGLRSDLAARASEAQVSTFERLLFTSRVKEFCRRDLVWCLPETPVSAAAREMRDRGVSSILVVPSLQAWTEGGIITTDDLRSRVVAESLDLATPARQIMSAPLRSIEGDRFAFEALLEMIQRRINYLPVVEEGQLLGLLCSRDLMLLQGHSPLLLARDTSRQSNPEGLRQSIERAAELVPRLVREGVAPAAIGQLVAGLADRVTSRLLALAEAKFGPAPLAWCWVAMGSEGRREQTFITDQDNALIHADPADAAEAEAATEYFAKFTAWVGEGLEQCGFPPCPADYMARNPRWRRPLAAWHAGFEEWIDSPSPGEVLHAIVFFDLRPVGGEARLAEEVIRGARARAARSPKFLRALAAAAVRHAPPLGFLRGFVVQEDGPQAGKFDLKLRGTMPVLDLVRLLAIQHELSETNSFERIQALGRAGHLPAAEAEELADTLEFLLLLRLRNQVEERAAGRQPSNFLAPDALSSVERATLREAFRVIERRQEALRLDFHLRGDA